MLIERNAPHIFAQDKMDLFKIHFINSRAGGAFTGIEVGNGC